MTNQIGAAMLALTLLCGAQPAPVRLVSPEVHARRLDFFPASDNGFLASLKDRPLIWYDDEVMPPAYQHNGGVHSPSYNISASKPSEPFGNANLEFPWKTTAGLDVVQNVRVHKFCSLPTGGVIRWERRADLIVWGYPEGTVFGELLLEQGQDGWHTFEVRTRRKSADGWRGNIFRPYASPVELADQVRALAPDDGQARDLAAFLEGPRMARFPEMVRNGHPVTVFEREALTDVLPPIPPALVAKLLDQPFRSVAGKEWLQGDYGTPCYAPTSTQRFSVVPQGYAAHAVKVSRRACMECHSTTLRHAFSLQGGRDWYGHVRGSDEIFSFHIFEPYCISYNGIARQPVLRQAFLSAGILRHVNE